jgi:hypothetical protein
VGEDARSRQAPEHDDDEETDGKAEPRAPASHPRAVTESPARGLVIVEPVFANGWSPALGSSIPTLDTCRSTRLIPGFIDTDEPVVGVAVRLFPAVSVCHAP